MQRRFASGKLTAIFLLAAAILVVEAGAGINEDLVAYYPFEGNCTDLSGNAHHGFANGGLTYDTGYRGLCASFDGVNDYVQLPIMVEENFTVVYRVRTTAVAPAGTEWFQGLGIKAAPFTESGGRPVTSAEITSVRSRWQELAHHKQEPMTSLSLASM